MSAEEEKLKEVASIDKKELWKKLTLPLTEEERMQWEDDIKSKGFPLPDESAVFDEYGLRLSIETLNQIGGGAIMLHIDLLANFVDAVTKDAVDRQQDKVREWVKFEEKEFTRDFFMGLLPGTPTCLGNAAYIALNYKSSKTKNRALKFLEAFLGFYMEVLKEQVAGQEKQNGVN